jgi:hypothetical protein
MGIQPKDKLPFCESFLTTFFLKLNTNGFTPMLFEKPKKKIKKHEFIV